MFSSDILDLVRLLLARCREKGLRVTTAESCTGGLLGGAITEIPGASKVYERGFVTYANIAKEELLGVHAATLAAHGAVSEETAREMAVGALARSRAHLAAAITGIAGPGGSEHKPEGRVCFGLARRSGPEAPDDEWSVMTETVDFGPLGRSNIRLAALGHALRGLLKLAEDA